VAAGPSLIRNGRTLVTSDEEIFFNTPIPNVHPRTAAGVDADGFLLLLVVDGRQAQSRGVSLEDLAAILEDLGAVDALNLDGGGSSSFVVNGQLLNRPAGSPEEREVVSSVAIHCRSVK
jgi:exopolysaccharide biosynthesis protein